MNVAHIIVSVLLAALLLTTGGGKLAGAASSQAIRDSLHVPPGRWKAIGAAEMALVAGLVAGIWIGPLGVIAPLGVVGLMVGAIAVRRAAGGPDQRAGIVADVVVLLVAAAAAGLGAAAL
jgi:hypothetical protein